MESKNSNLPKIWNPDRAKLQPETKIWRLRALIPQNYEVLIFLQQPKNIYNKAWPPKACSLNPDRTKLGPETKIIESKTSSITGISIDEEGIRIGWLLLLPILKWEETPSEKVPKEFNGSTFKGIQPLGKADRYQVMAWTMDRERRDRSQPLVGLDL